MNYSQLVITWGVFWPIVLLAIAVTPCCSGNDWNNSREDLQGQLDSLDRIHARMVASRILDGFGLSHPPNHTKLWRKRHIRPIDHSHENPQIRKMIFDVHILGHIPKGSHLRNPRKWFDCNRNDPLPISFPIHSAKGEITTANLRFLPDSDSSAAVPIFGSGGFFTLSVVPMSKEDHLPVSGFESIVENLSQSSVQNSSLELSNLVGYHLKAHSQLQALLTPNDIEDWCKISQFLTANPPAIHVQLVDLPSRGRRHLNGNNDLIGDCDVQWDENMLTQEMAQVNDALMPCCRRKVRVNFEELGWGDWVVAPRSFDSFYCLGRCRDFGGIGSGGASGSSFYTELMNSQLKPKFSLTPCCSPVQFSPLTVSVVSGPNEEITQTLEDVVVEQCGCL